MLQIIPLESAKRTGYEDIFLYENFYNILRNIAKFGLKMCENIQFLIFLSNKFYSFIS